MSLSNKEALFRKIGLIVLFGIMAFILMTVRNFIFESDQFFYLQQVELHGETYLTHRDIMALSGLKIKEKLFDSNLEKLKVKILRSPYVKNVEIERRLPSTLLIFIEEEVPLAYITNPSLTLLAESGRVLPRAVDFDMPDLPIINTKLKAPLKFGQYVESEPVLNALRFLRTSKLVSVDLYAIISEISLASKHKVRMVNGGAELIYSVEDMEDQLLNFSYFLDKKENLNFLSQIDYVDIRFKDRIIVKERKKG
jgi:cell division septal protein FtsQ